MADEDEVTEDVGGVQGTETVEAEPTDPVPEAAGDTPEQPAPDAGEIEWAGALVKKPPAPTN